MEEILEEFAQLVGRVLARRWLHHVQQAQHDQTARHDLRSADPKTCSDAAPAPLQTLVPDP